MGNKKNRLLKRRKNRGHERLANWRILKSYGHAVHKESDLECSSNFHNSCSSNSTVEVIQLDSKQTVWDEPEDKVMYLKTAPVAAVVISGPGLGAINVRCISSMTYDEHHQKVCKCTSREESALKQMRRAGEGVWTQGDVNVDHTNNTPLLMLKVKTSASWAKRTYSRKNNNSQSAAVCISHF